MHKSIVLAVPFIVLMISGCAMFQSWKSIPPPGGCDQCHNLPISSNWKVAYTPAVISSERNPNQPYFQTEQYTMPQTGKPESALERRKVEELKCFECHKSPTPEHKERKGRYHHGL